MSPKYQDILKQPIIHISDKDSLLGHHFCQGGTVIVGDPGSGKSSTSAMQIFCALLRAGFGAVCHTVKSEDTHNYIQWARQCGRDSDVIVFSEASGLRFDCLAYEWSRPTGRGGGDIETIIDYFSVLLSLGKPNSGGSSERFWELAAEQAMRNAIKLIQLAKEPLSIVNIHQTISSFPTYLGQQDDATWSEHSYTALLINGIRKRKESLSESEWQDLEVATEFIFSRWATLDERPRSSIAMTFAGMADKFMFHPLRGIFAAGVYDFTPEQVTHERKIIIIDFPILEYGKETARLIQCMTKLTFQRAWLRHKYVPGCCNGAMHFQDEFQLLMSRFENHFVQVCRSSGIAPVYITQTILNLSEEMNEAQLGPKTKAFLNNLGIKIAHRTTCPDTCNYFSDVIGKEYRYLDNFNAGSSGDSQSHSSFGGSRQLAYIVDPIAFTSLQRPTSSSPFAAAILYRGGDVFEVTRTTQNPGGRNYLSVLFSRD
jgi:type IV secretory pathway TraG/TraD family ATPase VirD4